MHIFMQIYSWLIQSFVPFLSASLVRPSDFAIWLIYDLMVLLLYTCNLSNVKIRSVDQVIIIYILMKLYVQYAN